MQTEGFFFSYLCWGVMWVFSATVASFEQNNNKTFRSRIPFWKNVQSLLSYRINQHLATDCSGYVWMWCDSVINNLVIHTLPNVFSGTTGQQCQLVIWALWILFACLFESQVGSDFHLNLLFSIASEVSAQSGKRRILLNRDPVVWWHWQVTSRIGWCNGAVPSWVLLVNHQLARRGGVDRSPCLPLTTKDLRSWEGEELGKG